MADTNTDTATIAYEDPDEGTVEKTVDDEHLTYVQDHWIVKTGEDDQGNDVVRRIPVERVHYVERTVESVDAVGSVFDDVQAFADEVGVEIESLRDRVETVAGELLAGPDRTGSQEEVREVEIEYTEDEGTEVEIEYTEDEDDEDEDDGDEGHDGDDGAAEDHSGDDEDDAAEDHGGDDGDDPR